MAAPVQPDAQDRPVTALLALGGTVVWGSGGVVAWGLAMMSVMVFDAPGSENNPYLKAVFMAVLSFPVLCMASVVAGWVAYAITRRWQGPLAVRGRRVRWAMALLPLCSLVALAVTAGVFQSACHGDFRCNAPEPTQGAQGVSPQRPPEGAPAVAPTPSPRASDGG